MYEPKISLDAIRDNSALEECTEIAQEIVKGNCSIINVVVSLKECLTHPEPLYRGGGMTFLANVIKHLPKAFLKNAELSQISNYLCERFKDSITVVSSCLEFLLVLFSMDNLDGDSIKILLRELFDNVPCQQQDKKDRLLYITVLRLCILKYPKVIEELGDEMLKGFTDSIDGERDPKVLVLNFKCFDELSKVLSNAEITEDIFEVFGVYFPIDFSAPVNENQQFTRNNLSKLLKKCLLAYRAFAKYAIPLALEKLDSDFEVAKLDSLEFLLESCNTYKDSDYKPYLQEITKLLRLEILRGGECKTCSLSLMVLRRLSETLDDSLRDFVNIILNFCLIFLQDDTMAQQHMLAVCVLNITAAGSKSACEIILNKTVPVLTKKKLTIGTVSQMNLLLQSYEKVQAELEEDVVKDLTEWLLKYDSSDIKVLIFISSCLILLSKCPDSDICKTIYEVILKSINEDGLFIPFCLSILQEMAKSDKNFINTFIPKLLESFSIDKEIENKIEVLVRLMLVESVSDTACQHFISNLENPKLFRTLLKSFINTYSNINDFHTKENILKKLIDQNDFINNIEDNLQRIEVIADEELLYIIRNIFVILSQDCEKQTVECLNKNRCSSWNPKSLVLYNGLISGFKKSNLQISYVAELLTSLVQSSLKDDQLEIFFANLTICYLINKYNDIEVLLNNLYDKLSFDDDSLLLKKVECVAWITKGLLLRSDKRFEDWLLKISDLDDQKLLVVYKILCLEFPIHDGNVGILHKQRLFITTEKLFKSKTISNYIKLFIYNLLMDYLPKSLLHMNHEQFTTILVESIRSEDNQLLLLSLNNIKNILELPQEQNNLCSSLYENIDRIMQRLIDLLANSDQQENILLILQIMNTYSSSTKYLSKLIQYKNQVLICLKKCLNNRNRTIRFLVQKCIENWKMIDQK